MRELLSAALLAALAVTNAAAADWTQFLGSNPAFPTQLAENGLAVDASGYVAVQTYNRLAWSGKIEFVHEYTLAADGNIPWIWGLVGRGASEEMLPQGVAQQDGRRLVWLTRTDNPWSIRDELSLLSPNSSQPSLWLAEPRNDGRVTNVVSGGNDGAFALRLLDGGAGFEVIAFDGSYSRWRAALQPCAAGFEPRNLEMDYAPATAWSGHPVLSVAGSCSDGITPAQVFVQRFDAGHGLQGAPEWIAAAAHNDLARLAFSPAHELVAIYDTPWPHKEVHRIGAPGSSYLPPDFLHGVDQVVALAAGGDSLAIVGKNVAGDYAVASLTPFAPVPMARTLTGLAGFAGDGWTIAAGRDGKLLAMRVEPGASTSLLRLVGLDAYGLLEWTQTIDDVVSGSQPQAVPAQDADGGFVVAVDKLAATGTLGVHVQRVGSSP
ncbi:MAG: hypothetical protein JNN30_21015 [Rhodanobacteraceae bacterium]|nr:hypothetical protein [Rhodanobacteraceae bacterium]